MHFCLFSQAIYSLVSGSQAETKVEDSISRKDLHYIKTRNWAADRHMTLIFSSKTQKMISLAPERFSNKLKGSLHIPTVGRV